MAVERLVTDTRGLVEHGERHDAGGALTIGPVAWRRVLVVAVVAVQRFGHEVARAADTDLGEHLLVLRSRVVGVDPDRNERAEGKLVARDGDHRLDLLGVFVVDVHLQTAR